MIIMDDPNIHNARWLVNETGKQWEHRANCAAAVETLKKIEGGELEATDEAILKLQALAQKSLLYCQIMARLN